MATIALHGPGASAARVNYWDSERQAKSRLEHLPTTSDGLIPARSFEDRVNRAETVLEAAACEEKLLSADEIAAEFVAETAADRSQPAATSRAPVTIPMANNPELDFLAPLPGTAPPAMAWTETPTLRDAENVAVPLPSSAWTGFTCLGGIATYYLLRKVHRALR